MNVGIGFTILAFLYFCIFLYFLRGRFNIFFNESFTKAKFGISVRWFDETSPHVLIKSVKNVKFGLKVIIIAGSITPNMLMNKHSRVNMKTEGFSRSLSVFS